MNLEILKSLAKVISDQDKLLKAYKDATNESITMSELLSALVPKGKKGRANPTTDLLSTYCETVADMKRVKAKEMELDECIAKHTEIIKKFIA